MFVYGAGACPFVVTRTALPWSGDKKRSDSSSFFYFILIEFSHQLIDAKNPARGHKVEKHNPEGKNVRRTLNTKRKRQWYKKYSEKAASPNKQKEKRKKHVWLSGRVNKGPRLQRKREEEKEAKQNKRC